MSQTILGNRTQASLHSIQLNVSELAQHSAQSDIELDVVLACSCS